MHDDVKKTLEELEQTFAIVHRVATRQTDAAYMSIPADPKRDADLRHMAAVETLRAHIDAEPARLAAAKTEAAEQAWGEAVKATELEQAHVRLRAVAAAREEQREALGLGRWPVLIPFLAAMVRKLDANRAKKGGREGWQNDDPRDLLVRVREEVIEVERVLLNISARGDSLTAPLVSKFREDVLNEAADVANMVMMVADASGALDATPLTATPLAERIAELEAQIKNLMEVNAMVGQDCNLRADKAEARERELEATLDAARDQIDDLEGDVRELSISVEKLKNDRDAALARAKELEATLDVTRRVRDGREAYWTQRQTDLIAEVDRAGAGCDFHAKRADAVERELAAALARVRELEAQGQRWVGIVGMSLEEMAKNCGGETLDEHLWRMSSVACAFALDQGLRSGIPEWFTRLLLNGAYADRDESMRQRDALKAQLAEVLCRLAFGDEQ